MLSVVLVNGLTESGTGRGDNSLLPLIRDRFPNARVKPYDFLPEGKQALGDGGLRERAEEILQDLINDEKLNQNYDAGHWSGGTAPLIFLSHGLGGSLVKQMLLRAGEYWQYQPIATSTKTLFFFGTPHRSRTKLELEYHVFRILSAFNLQHVSPLALMQELPLVLSDLEEDFPTISGNYDIVNFFEQKAMSSEGTVVLDEYSSTMNSHSGENIGLTCNHGELWQFMPGEPRTESILQKIETLGKPEMKYFNSNYHRFLRHLSQVDPRTHRLKLSKAAPGSTDWISTNDNFLNWKACMGTTVLHVCGLPGSGTTMSSSQIVKLLKPDPLNKDATFISFSFNKQDVQSCQENSLYLSLSRQLLSDRPSLFQQTSPLCSWIMDQSILTRESLWALLRSLLTTPFRGPVFCIIGNVDECETSWKSLVENLASVESPEQVPLRFLLTSEKCFDSQLSCGPDRYFLIHLNDENQMVSAISQLVTNRLSRLVQAKPVWKGFENEVVEKICLTNTTYFLANKQMDFLESPMIRSTKVTIARRLSNLPHSLPEVYRRVLDQIPKRRYEWAIFALSWIVHAVRPLKHCELAVALALKDKKIKSLESLRENISCDIMGDISQLIGPLIKISDGRLYPIHRTVGTQEDLTESPAKFHTVMLSTCLEYLSIMGKSGKLSQKGRDYSQVACSPDAEFQLLGYAVLHWSEHYRQAESKYTPGMTDGSTTYQGPIELTTEVFKFLNDALLLQTWSNMHNILGLPKAGPYVPFGTPLNAAARFGLLHVVAKSLDLVNSSISAEDLQVALNLAAQHGHTETVKTLLSRGATSDQALGLAASGGYLDVMNELFSINNLEKPDGRGCTPLLQATIGGHHEVVLELLNRGASPNAKTLYGFTALHFTARIGQMAPTKELIKRNADQNASNLTGFVPLHFAAEGGFVDVVNELLDHGASVGKKTANGDTPLHLAVTGGHLSTCEALLNWKANPTSRNNLGLTPLHLASKEGYLSIVKLLFGHGAGSQTLPGDATENEDPSLPPTSPVSHCESGKGVISPLQFAAQNGHVDILRVLLIREETGDDGDPKSNTKSLVDPDDINLALRAAAKAGHLSVVKELIGRNIDISATDLNGKTALHLAVIANHSNVIMELAKVSVVDATNNEGQTPLHLAAESGNAEVIRILTDHGAQVARKTITGDTPLHLAAKKGQVLAVRALQRKEDTSSMLNDQKRTAISLAAMNGNVAVVKELLDGHQDSHGDGPSDHDTGLLHEVVKSGNEKILQKLLENGFPYDRLKEGLTPLHVAAREGHSAVIEVLLRMGAEVNTRSTYQTNEKTPLIFAAENGKEDACKVLLEAGAEVDVKNSDGDTALFRAATRGFPNIIEQLLKKNAYVNMKNSTGWTALHAAIQSPSSFAVTNLLLDAKADANVKNDYGSTPVVLAAQTGRTNVIRLLLKAGADPKVTNRSGSTSLHRAAAAGHLDTVKVLVEEGKADCNGAKDDGSTPLYMAALYGHTSTVKYLIGITKNIDSQGPESASPLAAASMVEEANKDGYLSTAKLLISKGADVNSYGGYFHSALQTAIHFGSLEMVQLLLRNNADANAIGGRYGTALNAAIENERLDIMEVLLDNKTNKRTDPDIRFNGYTALKLAIDGANVRIVEALLKHGANQDLPIQENDTAIRAAARGDLLDIFKALVEAKANLSSDDSSTRPILTDAIGWYSSGVVEYLLSVGGIDLNQKDLMGRSPLMFSILSERSAAENLLKAGADPDTTDSEGKTPLIHAIMNNNERLAAMLWERNASPSIRDAFGRGPLYWACYFGNEKRFESILGALADHDDREAHCNLAIHAAAAKNRTRFLKKLLEVENVDPNEWDRNGWTPLFTASRYGFEDIEAQLNAAEITKLLRRQLSYKLVRPRKRETSPSPRGRKKAKKGYSAHRSPASRTEELSLKSPSGWDPKDKAPLLIISNGGLTVTVEDAKSPPYLGKVRGMVRANYCIPTNRGVFYFEVKIERGNDTTNNDSVLEAGIGFCEEHVSLRNMVGWDEGAWGFHSDDGNLYDQSGSGTSYSDTYTEGDVIGCGVNFERKIAFYTRNGKIIGPAFSDIRGKLYPAVSFDMTQAGVSISVNFGNDENILFAYQGSLEDEATYKIRRPSDFLIEDAKSEKSEHSDSDSDSIAD